MSVTRTTTHHTFTDKKDEPPKTSLQRLIASSRQQQQQQQMNNNNTDLTIRFVLVEGDLQKSWKHTKENGVYIKTALDAIMFHLNYLPCKPTQPVEIDLFPYPSALWETKPLTKDFHHLGTFFGGAFSLKIDHRIEPWLVMIVKRTSVKNEGVKNGEVVKRYT